MSVFLLGNHNLTPAATVRIRLAKDISSFDGAWNNSSTITYSATLPYNSGTINVEVTATSAAALQLYVADRAQTATQIGRLWAGIHHIKQYANTSENWITWASRKWDNRTKVFVSEAGASWFDKRDKVIEWNIPLDPLDPYLNPDTISLLDSLLERVQTHQSFYVQFDSADPLGSTVYGYLVGDFTWRRMRNTPVTDLRSLLLREQK